MKRWVEAHPEATDPKGLTLADLRHLMMVLDDIGDAPGEARVTAKIRMDGRIKSLKVAWS